MLDCFVFLITCGAPAYRLASTHHAYAPVIPSVCLSYRFPWSVARSSRDKVCKNSLPWFPTDQSSREKDGLNSHNGGQNWRREPLRTVRFSPPIPHPGPSVRFWCCAPPPTAQRLDRPHLATPTCPSTCGYRSETPRPRFLMSPMNRERRSISLRPAPGERSSDEPHLRGLFEHHMEYPTSCVSPVHCSMWNTHLTDDVQWAGAYAGAEFLSPAPLLPVTPW